MRGIIASRPGESRDKSDEWQGRFNIWFIVIASSLFTALTVIQSLRQGQLSIPVTYDDVGYFSDALYRLQILYDDGIKSLIKNLFVEPAHAPIATLIPFIGFAVIGIHDWAPAIVNVVWVALILIFVRVLLHDLPRWAFVSIGLATLSWPLSSAIVLESRPDILTSLLVVMGCTLMFRSSFLHASRRHIVTIAVLFGVALIAKPSISPITLLIYCASLAICVIIERSQSSDEDFFREAARRVCVSIAISAVIALPYFIVAWRSIYSYIYTVTVERKELYGTRMGLFDTAGYYLWGIGGKVMMGSWFWITLILVVIAALLSTVTTRSINKRALGLLVVFIGAYAMVTIPITKSTFLGVIVSSFFLAFFITASGGILRYLLRSGTLGKWVAVGFAGALLAASAMAFQWHWQNHSGVPQAARTNLIASRRYQIIRQLGDYLENHEDEYTKQHIFFPVVTDYLNADTLLFELQKRRMGQDEVLWDLPSLEAQRAALETADHVVIFDEDDPEILWRLPSSGVYSQIRALVVNDPRFVNTVEVPTADGDHRIRVYTRQSSSHAMPFHNLRPLAGFSSLEGPYPQWNLPYVRWTTGPLARAKFATTGTGAGRLVLQAHSAAGQSIAIQIDGEPVGTCDLAVSALLVDCSFPVYISRPDPVIELRFAKSGSKEQGMKSVLFSELRLDF